MKHKKTVPAQTRLEPDLYADISYHADIHGRSISSEICQLIKEAMGYRENSTHEFAKPRRKK